MGDSKYVVHDEIASGGMASVYLARLVGPSGFTRSVAVKRPHPHLTKDEAFVAMFIDEARLAARVRHPNVVSTLDVIRSPSELVLVMEYVHGEALSRLVSESNSRGERVPQTIAATILIDVLHGLHAAHEATDENGSPLGLVHRDISPQNILVGLDGIARIVDFGIAKASGRSYTTQDGALKGKYAYMAPEQARGETVSRLTDVFSASIVFWELLTGERLFLGKTDAQTMHKCLISRVRAPSTFVPDLPARLDAIVLRGLSRDPSRRYATAREMALDIEEAVVAIRASEVAAWVEKLAGKSLTAKAAALSKMERTPTVTPPEVEAERAREPMSEPKTVTAAPAPPVSTRVLFGAGAMDSSVSGVSSSRRESARPKKRMSPFALAAALLACTIPIALAIVVTQRAAPRVGAAPRPTESAAPPATSAPALTAPVPAPTPLASTPPNALPSAAPTASTPTPTSTPSGLPSRAKVRAPSKTAPAASSPTQADPLNCNPPYSVDGLGRQIFKLECL